MQLWSPWRGDAVELVGLRRHVVGVAVVLLHGGDTLEILERRVDQVVAVGLIVFGFV